MRGWIPVLGDASLLRCALELFSVKALSYSLLLIWFCLYVPV